MSSNAAKVSLKEFAQLAKDIADNRYPIMLRGSHGIGKTEFIRQFAKSIELDTVEIRCAQLMEGDLLGLPRKGNWCSSTKNEKFPCTSFLAPDWLIRACNEPVVLFFDEVDRAREEIAMGIMQLTDSRCLMGNKLHPDTLIFAAVNGGFDGGVNYSVRALDPAEQSRWSIFDACPVVQDWIEWGYKKNEKGNTNIHPSILEFISEFNQHWNHEPGQAGYEPGKVYPVPRSWKRYSDCAWNYLEQEGSCTQISTLGASFLGSETATAFHSWRLNYNNQCTLDDVLKGKWDKVSRASHEANCAIFEQIEGKKLFGTKTPNGKHTLSSTELKNVLRFIVNCPNELIKKGVAIIANGNNDTIKEIYKTKISDCRWKPKDDITWSEVATLVVSTEEYKKRMNISLPSS
jgi:hypothetical protein